LERLEQARSDGRAEHWETDTPRWRRPHQVLVRMFFAVLPASDDVIIWRKHWWVLFTRLVTPIILAIAFLAITVVWLQYELPSQGQIIWLLGFVAALLWIVWQAIDWRNDVYMMTPNRVVDIEKRPFVFEDRLEASLSMIQDVRYTQPSFISMLFDFGHVYLETAGEQGGLTFDSVPHPKRVQSDIMDRVRAFRLEARMKEQTQRRQEMRAVVDEMLRDRRTAVQ